MPLIKYRTNEEETNEIMVDFNMTVSDFIKKINQTSTRKYTKCIFRGKVLEDNDLIRNHITKPEHVLILIADTNPNSNDIMDFGRGLILNPNKKEVRNIVTSSLLRRVGANRERHHFEYTFTIYTTATTDSMFHGHKIKFLLNSRYSEVYNRIHNLIYSFEQIDSKFEFDLLLFLPGGVHFKSDALIDYYLNPDIITFDNIYAIVIKKPNNAYSIEDPINDPSFCSNPQRKEVLSPFCDSSIAGITQIASFLGYMFHNGVRREHILLSFAKITRFAPLVVNLYRLMIKRPINVLNILAITAPLFTLFRSVLPKQVQNANVFEYTLKLLSVFDVISNFDFLTFLEIDTKDEKQEEGMDYLVNYCKNTNQQQHVIVWTADTINPNFESSIMQPIEFEKIQNIFQTVTTFKPVAPLSLHNIFYPTFIRCSEENKVMFFIKEVPDKGNTISIINPLEGCLKEIEIEELARQMKCDIKDDIFSLIDPNQVDQIIFICFDESLSMKWALDHANPHHNEKTRVKVAIELLKALVKQSFTLRISSFYGLISFGSEVKVRQTLTAMISQFVKSLEKIQPRGNTFLYDAINIAQQQICNLVKGEDGKSRFPNAKLRIIVISDGSDNKSITEPDILVNDLIRNEIVVDTILLSSIDRNEGCFAISNLTGGLCFIPKNLEDGIRIFEQEAFLDINMRHMEPLPYNQITQKIFIEEKEKMKDHLSLYAPNQMIINANSKVSLATPKYMSYILSKEYFKQHRFNRLFIELSMINKQPNDCYVVYSLYATPEEWRIFIKGPKNSVFSDKWLNMYMVIPSNYPIEPPHFRFLTIPFHPNVSSEGTVIFGLNDRDYNFSLRIDSIILGICNLLENPDENYTINTKAMELFKNNANEYRRIQEEGEIGCNDYHEYLQDTKIYSEIPVNAIVSDEGRNNSKIVSITRNALNEAALKEGEVKDKYLLDINDFNRIKEIGHGSFGTVYLVEDKNTHIQYAAKIPRYIVNDDDDDDDDEKQIIDYVKLVNVISNFSHAAIVKVYGYCLNDFKGTNKHVIIMEYVPNDNLNKIMNEEKRGEMRKGWDDTQKLITLYGIASGMAYFASYDTTNSDLKPENILMTNDLCPKISDFDAFRMKAEDNKQSFNRSDCDIISPIYSAPEVLEANPGYKQYAEKSDVYSFSMIAFQLITKIVPFYSINKIFIEQKVKEGIRPEIPHSLSSSYKQLIEECWNQAPDKRPTFEQIVEYMKTEHFSLDNNIDRERFQKYVDYVDNYKNIFTVSKQVRPKTEADKKKNKDEKEKESKEQIAKENEKEEEKENEKEEEKENEKEEEKENEKEEEKENEKEEEKESEKEEEKESEKEKDEDIDEVIKNSSNINIVNINDFDQKNNLGSGHFSQVVLITEKSTQKNFAAKISLNTISKETSNHILIEVNIMKSLNHPCILKFIGYSPVDFENEPKPVIITEYSSKGSLQNVINNQSKYKDWNDTKKYIIIYGIVSGMAYLHEHNIIHNDLKPSNVLLDENFYPKIADFGLSQAIAKSEDNTNKSFNIKGTPSYIAPEIWEEQNYYEASDVYSFGILLYELVLMKKAFEGMKPLQIGSKVIANERPPFPFFFSNPLKSLIQKCWAKNPNDRPTFKEIAAELQDKKYMTKYINKEEYTKYIHYIQNFDKK